MEEETRTEELSGLGTKRVCSRGRLLSHCQPGFNNSSSSARLEFELSNDFPLQVL